MQTIGKYEIIDKIGEGTFGEVWRARDTGLDKEVAIKLLKRMQLGNPRAVAAFQREARLAAKLEHPNIVQVYGIDNEDGMLYIVMQLLRGESLEQRLQRGAPFSVAQAAPILTQLADALKHAHAQGVIHRDIKPANIVLRESDGRPILTDFGLAHAGEVAGSVAGGGSSGGVIGTHAYIAPELWDGQPASPASDSYALACVAYQMLTGRVLFGGSTAMAVLRAHDRGPDLAAIDEPDVRDALALALTRDPAQRALAQEWVPKLGGSEAAASAARESELSATAAAAKLRQDNENAVRAEQASREQVANDAHVAAEQRRGRAREAEAKTEAMLLQLNWRDAHQHAQAWLAAAPESVEAGNALTLAQAELAKSNSLQTRRALLIGGGVIASGVGLWQMTRFFGAAGTNTQSTQVAPTLTVSPIPKAAPITTTASTVLTVATTATPATPTRAATAAGKVRIANINNVGQRQREQVVIVNAGDLVYIKGWTLANGRGISYTFLNVALTRDTYVNVYTSEGSDAAGNLFWNRADAAWQVGDLVTLRDAEGLKVDDFVIR